MNQRIKKKKLKQEIRIASEGINTINQFMKNLKEHPVEMRKAIIDSSIDFPEKAKLVLLTYIFEKQKNESL